jgi:hypothetical protein
MRNCVDEGVLQAWFDGELAAEEAANVETHLHECERCAESVRVLETEDSVVSSALALEFAEAIPTERLRERINAAVTAMPPTSAAGERAWTNTIGNFFASFRLPVYAVAAAAIVLAALLGLIYLRRSKPAPIIVQNNGQETVPVPPPASTPSPLAPVHVVTGTTAPSPQHPRKSRIRNENPQSPATSLAWQERQYERAIAKLNEAIKSQPPMRPSLQVEYEYNLAVINAAITATRDAARKNPKDPQAAQFVLTAYQSKVDLMNQIADARVLER